MQTPSIELVAAVARDGGIGRGNALVWREPEDLRRFKSLTMGSPVVMGRLTWESLGRPLPGRRNIVITRDAHWHAEGAERASSLEDAIELASAAPKVFVIGGAQIYKLALTIADVLHLTEVDGTFEADTFFPPWPRESFEKEAGDLRQSQSGEPYRFVTYRRKPTTR